MSSAENKTVIQRFYEEVFGRGNIGYADEVMASNFVDHDPLNPGGTRESFKQVIPSLKVAFPDSRMVIEDMIAEGDKVVTRLTMHGTHNGPLFMGPESSLPPTGKHITVTGIDIIQLSDGKFIEHWGEYDQLGMLQQLGAIPMPGEAPAPA